MFGFANLAAGRQLKKDYSQFKKHVLQYCKDHAFKYFEVYRKLKEENLQQNNIIKEDNIKEDN